MKESFTFHILCGILWQNLHKAFLFPLNTKALEEQQVQILYLILASSTQFIQLHGLKGYMTQLRKSKRHCWPIASGNSNWPLVCQKTSAWKKPVLLSYKRM